MPQVRERRQAGSYPGCMLRNRPVSRTASRGEAPDALGVSPDFFDEHCTSAISSSSRSPSLSAGGSGGSIPVAVRVKRMLG